ncbi:class I SAM-dependent methyltransferase [Glycomyces harbinensis]|uniref:Methyltransferase domain-containing protein n=1 Tax=Glycomyces harbinensis TaxID=58114 RepID=A0A1G7ASJ4_9ACTN|nr:class I SAM-dependent methyltransferase [Glycomyces harbinensis]SDE17517.1 Methyltransferase domain-containing protein [Glycomyces harbinensis]
MANESMRQNWTDGAAGWVANEAVFDAVFAPVTAALLDAARPAPGRRVLDVGCGTGTLLAKSAAAGAQVVGVDISEGMAAAARGRVPEATVLVADAQTADLLGQAPGAPFDLVVSRFGVMFFEDPQAAFANLRRAAAPGARLVFACWRSLEENPMFSLGSTVLADRLDPKPESPAPGAPGPTAFADRGRLDALLTGAGWDSVRIDAFDFTCDYGFNGTDGVEERVTTVLSGGLGRLAREQLVPRIGVDGWESLVDEVRAELRRRLVGGVLRFPGAVWIAGAENPA